MREDTDKAKGHSLMRFMLGLLMVCAMVAGGEGDRRLSDTVYAYKARYEASLGPIFLARQEGAGRAAETYGQALPKLLSRIQKRGDLDYTLVIQSEIARTGKTPTAPDELAGRAMPELRKLQRRFRKEMSRIDTERDCALGQLRASYRRALGELEKRLVAAGEIEEAKLARATRDRAARGGGRPRADARPAVVEAQHAVSGRWLWLGRIARSHSVDGTITKGASGKREGVIKYAETDERNRYVYKYVLEGKGGAGTAVLRRDGGTLDITTSSNIKFKATHVH